MESNNLPVSIIITNGSNFDPFLSLWKNEVVRHVSEICFYIFHRFHSARQWFVANLRFDKRMNDIISLQTDESCNWQFIGGLLICLVELLFQTVLSVSIKYNITKLL